MPYSADPFHPLSQSSVSRSGQLLPRRRDSYILKNAFSCYFKGTDRKKYAIMKLPITTTCFYHLFI